MNKISSIIILIIFIYCNIIYGSIEFTDDGAIMSIELKTAGYAVDEDFDGIFDKRYFSNDRLQVRVGNLSWGESRGYIEFNLSQITDELRYEPNPNTMLTLDKIYLYRYWYSGTGTNPNTNLYGYIGNGKIDSTDVYETDFLITTIIKPYGSIDVTDFIISLKEQEKYAGFVLKENKLNLIYNYGNFRLNAIYVPEPTTFIILLMGIISLKIKQ